MRRSLIGCGIVAVAMFLAIDYARLHCAVARVTATNLTERPAEEFAIGQGPRLVLLPVTISGKTVLFCVDTGAWKTIFDESFRTSLGQSLGKTTAATPSGFLEIELFACPKAAVGSLDLAHIESVGCEDLTKMRYASGQEIYGLLGMDFLRGRAIEFDFDAGKCRIWNGAPQDWIKQGTSFALSFDESNRPQVVAQLPGLGNEKFTIDTGANSSTLRSGVFDELARKGEIKTGTTHVGMAMAGSFRAQTGYVNELKLDTFSHKNVRLDRDPFSALGIRYLSRYKIRLDFGGAKAYFAGGSRFAKPEPIATSGISILQVNGEKVVYSVEPAGPAAASGLAPGDVILGVNGHDAHDYDMVSLHEVLTCEPGASVDLHLRRSNQAFNVALTLESRLVARR